MFKKLLFVSLSALCVFATAALLENYLPAYQYAATILSTTGPIKHLPDDRVAGETSASFPTAPRANTTKATQTPSASIKESPPVPTTLKTTPVEPPIDVETVNASVREASVNVVCQSKNSESPISASGVIIDPRGVVLTNAHVAQYLLLRDSGNVALTCHVRTGSPAAVSWDVRVLYISSKWVHAHANEIRESHATGTGENDYALLQITGSVSGSPLPSSFPFVSPDFGSAASYTNQGVIVASYPAGFLGGVITLGNLNLISTITQIQQIFTYGTGSHDIVSLGGVIVAQSGSSGGAVVNLAKRLIAIIATSSTGNQTSERDLRGITLYHIDQGLISETGKSLSEYISGDLGATARAFAKDIEPSLIKALLDELVK